MPQGKLLVLSGPSGAGKGTIVSALRQQFNPVWISISATTRSPRRGEEDGREYFFLTREVFEELIASDGLLEFANVHENLYGTPRAEVEKHLQAGETVILEIDPQGAFQVKQHAPEAILVFIMPPSTEELERRLRSRNTESEEEISLRLKTAIEEIKLAERYDFVVLNTDVKNAVKEVIDIITS